QWVRAHPEVFESYLSPALEDHQRRRVANRDWPDYIESVALSFIRSAKDLHLSPEDLRVALEQAREPLPLAEMGQEIYADYQRALAYRGAVDFDDLIRLAYQALRSSPGLLERLRHRWPFILEDEAQDSSRIQKEIISLLAGPGGNWVRVGDPNQAIFETFTTANPELLRDFIANNPSIDMPESGRSQPSVLDIANFLIDWVRAEHPVMDARDALQPPYIIPVPPDDPQPNPPDDPEAIQLIKTKMGPDEEIRELIRSLEAWLPDHPDSTVAVLTCTNDYAAQVAEALKVQRIEYRELLRSTSPTRAAAGALSYIMDYLAAPDSAPKLAQAYKVWRRAWRTDLACRPMFDYVAGTLRRLRNVETYIAPFVPAGSVEKLDDVLAADEESSEVMAELAAFREVVLRWHSATILPIDQLVLTLAQELFSVPADLALAHKLALVLRQAAEENPDWRLPEFIPMLNEIARNERRFIGFSSDDAGFDPDDYRGIVIVSTMHKAKGLEWDRVYLLSVNNFDYPSDQPGDRFIAEKWFLRDDLNLEAEVLAQLEVAQDTSGDSFYAEGAATLQARVDYVRERLRLLFVGITRARRELIVSWNSGRRGDAAPAAALQALWQWWQQSREPRDL
ncbi:MAG TPA: ATP-dependent helicase, partial [Anaerolineales bacterium]|nr:ATP-dependent helicase [Anaerolineales bacterium]